MRKPGSVIRPVITKNVATMWKRSERRQDSGDVVDVAVVDRDDHRLGRKRRSLVQRVEQLRLVDRVVAAGVQGRELGDEVGGLDLQIGDPDGAERRDAVVGQDGDVDAANRRARRRNQGRDGSMRGGEHAWRDERARPLP